MAWSHIAMSGEPAFPPTDWRFNEFPNPAAHALYVTCVELMANPRTPEIVGECLLDVIAKGYVEIPSQQLELWINSVGLVISAMPNPYWKILNERLVKMTKELSTWKYRNSPFQLFNFTNTSDSLLENKFSYTLALTHSMWHHAGPGHMNSIPQFVKEHLQPLVQSEEQLLFVCHMIGPFLQRFTTERLLELTVRLCEMLEQVDKNGSPLKHMDTICDLLYHIKYMYVGDMMKAEVEGVIRKLRPALQMRLRFIAHLNPEEIQAS